MDVSNGIDSPRHGRAAEQTPVRQDSYFDGNTWQYIGYHLLSFLVCTLTLGIAYPWMLCMIRRWEVKHTVIHGRRLRFSRTEPCFWTDGSIIRGAIRLRICAGVSAIQSTERTTVRMTAPVF